MKMLRSALIGLALFALSSPALAQVWRASDGAHVCVDVEGRDFQVVCRAIGDVANGRGKLMVLTPHGLPTMVQ